MATNLGELALSVVRNTRDDRKYNIIDYIEREWGLNRTLFPVQRVILKAHYGIPLKTSGKQVRVRTWRGDLRYYLSEADYLKMLHDEGRSNIREVIEGQERRKLRLAIGRRGGKTMISGCIMSYEADKLIKMGNPHEYYGIARSSRIQMIAVATDQKQASELYNEVSGHFADCQNFHPYLANATQTYTKLQTPDDIQRYGSWAEDNSARASIEITFKPCRGSGLRGGNNIVVVLDEFAHFAENGEGSAPVIYQAVSPSQSAFVPLNPDDPETPLGPKEGRFILISSPMGKSGFFFNKYMQGWQTGSGSDNILCIQAPSWEVNPSISPKDLAEAYADDPIAFNTEFGASFASGARTWIKDARDLTNCINPKLRPKARPTQRFHHFLGCDIAAKNHMSSFAVGHINRAGNIELDLLDWIQAGFGKYEGILRIPFDDIADWLADACRRFNVRAGLSDQHLGTPLEDALRKRGITCIEARHHTRDFNALLYKNFKDMLWDERIELYNWPIPEQRPGQMAGESYCEYLEELLELEENLKGRDTFIVSAPPLNNKFDDRSDALARMIWLASERISQNPRVARGHAHGSRVQELPGETRYTARREAMRKRLAGGSHPSRQVNPRFRRGW